jgi:SAM-dependent methyltransferase
MGISMLQSDYLMEHDEEAFRLDLKTEKSSITSQALWAGIKPGMRVADIGCGSGKTTHYLHKLIQPHGKIVGIDSSEARINHANEHYRESGIEFICKDIRTSLDELGKFDFIWVRFVLEYYRSSSSDIVRNLSDLLKPGGILCLVDLDYNCLNHFELPPKLEKTICTVMETLENKCDFDPYAGRKLYSYLYDTGFRDIAVDVAHHHLIYGELDEKDAYNWMKKVEIAAKKSGHSFDDYDGGYEQFVSEFSSFFNDPRRFTYTPIISCRGCKSLR